MTATHRRALERELDRVEAERSALENRSFELRYVARYLQQRLDDNPPPTTRKD